MTDGAEAARIAVAHRRLVNDRSFQFDFPTYLQPRPPAWLEPLMTFMKWASPAFPYLFWGVVALVVLTTTWVVLRDFAGFRWLDRRAKPAREADWAPAASVARALLSQAEALAAEGRYAEAARLLLRRSVEDIGERLPQLLKPSLTARDIANADALPAAARPAFASIARVVEVSAFGTRTVTAETWAACLAAYRRFALPGSWNAHD